MADWPYNTARWQRLRAAKLAANPLCQYCPPRKVTAANTVDHRRPITGGGDPWDWDNLVSSCTPCHSRKTARGSEAGSAKSNRPMKGCDPAGDPLDPSHPWST